MITAYLVDVRGSIENTSAIIHAASHDEAMRIYARDVVLNEDETNEATAFVNAEDGDVVRSARIGAQEAAGLIPWDDVEMVEKALGEIHEEATLEP